MHRTAALLAALALLGGCKDRNKDGADAKAQAAGQPADAADAPPIPQAAPVHPFAPKAAVRNEPRAPDNSELGRNLQKIKLPPGFRIEVFARGLENARSMVRGEAGTLFVGTRKVGNVYAAIDADGDHVADRTLTLASDLNTPNGVAFRDKALFVAEIDRIWRYDDIESRLDDPPKPVSVRDDFPTEKHHGWKYIAFGPDGWLYVPVGAPCNICEMEDPRYASIMRMKPDGSAVEVFANGVRNSVGFDWHPKTRELWFTDNGRDLMGDDVPNDELNHAPRPGMHFGYPYCHAGFVPDPEFSLPKSLWAKKNGRPARCEDFVAPARKLGAHVAALGMRFYTGDMFPPEYRERIFIPEHGSWNRSKKTGYRITMAWPKEDGSMHYETFAEGWLQGEEAWGRPVAILQWPDGSLLVSDDRAGAIYRVSYDAAAAAEPPTTPPAKPPGGRDTKETP